MQRCKGRWDVQAHLTETMITEGLFLIQKVIFLIFLIKVKQTKNWCYSNPKHSNWVEVKIAYYCIQATTSTPKLSSRTRYREQTMIKNVWRAHFHHLTNKSLTATYQPQKWRESPCKTQFWRVISSRFGSQPWQCATTWSRGFDLLQGWFCFLWSSFAQSTLFLSSFPPYISSIHLINLSDMQHIDRRWGGKGGGGAVVLRLGGVIW